MDADDAGRGPQYMTVEEVAARLRVQPTTVRKWLRAGELHGVKLGPKLWRIAERDLAEFLRRK